MRIYSYPALVLVFLLLSINMLVGKTTPKQTNTLTGVLSLVTR